MAPNKQGGGTLHGYPPMLVDPGEGPNNGREPDRGVGIRRKGWVGGAPRPLRILSRRAVQSCLV